MTNTQMINIQGTDYRYDSEQVINFKEGLVGFPNLTRAALIPLAEYEPFCWLASIDDDCVRFIVVDPNQIYGNYQPTSEKSEFSKMDTLALVKISSDWRKTTVNLRAPIFVDSNTRNATQTILSDTDYQMEEMLPNT
jgi:flagellar assembly factor FliW